MRTLSILVLVCAGSFWLSSCYSLKQIYFQGNLLATREPIAVLLWKDNTSKPLKEKLKTLNEILDFARQEGLNVGGAYSSYIASDRRAVSYIVQAAKPFEMKLKTWNFPILGRVSYLGFFHESERDEFASKLREEGYETSMGQADAFSSLGWFDDPVFSSMLNRSEVRLASLIFHELTHRSLWIHGESEFNENLAEFVGTQMTMDFLSFKQKNEELLDFKVKQKERLIFLEWLLSMKKELTHYYHSSFKLDLKSRAQGKQKIIEHYSENLFPKFQSNHFESLRKKEWNNAEILAHTMYLPELSPFENAYRCSGAKTLGSFLLKLESVEIPNMGGHERLKQLCVDKGA